MKTIGLIGGMSYKSTLEYYKIINETVNKRLGNNHSAKLILYSVDFEEVDKYQKENNWSQIRIMMIEAAKTLKHAGADFIVIAANTMHLIADDIKEEVSIEVLHIADVVGQSIKDKKLRKVGLIGTQFTVENNFYKERLKQKYDIDVIIPNKEQCKIVHEIIYEELIKGITTKDSKQQYINIINELIKSGAEGIILGCTEIPLLIKQEDVSIEVFNSTKIHSIFSANYALENRRNL